MGEDSAHAGGAQSVMQKQSPPAPSSATKALASGATQGGANSDPPANSNAHSAQDGEFAHAAEAIHQAVQDNPDIANLSHQVITENTPQGLRIQLVDQDGRPMFQQGSTEPMPYTKKLLAAVGGIIAGLPNRVSISGHTGGNDTDRQPAGNCRPTAPTRPAPCCRRAGWAATASTKWRARRAPSRCCPKTPMPAPTAGFPSC